MAQPASGQINCRFPERTFSLVIDLLRECAENEDRSQQGVLRSVIRDGLKQRAAAAHA